MGGSSRIAGSTILVIEDNPLIGLDIAFLLEDEGATVFGPFATSEGAREGMRASGAGMAVACAVLDYDLGNETTAEIAVELHRSGVPVVFYTGDQDRVADLAGRLDAAVIEKPSRPGYLLETIAANLRARPRVE